MRASVIIFLILAILLVIFTLQNLIGISIHFLFWEVVNAPLALVIFVCLVLGYLLSTIYFLPKVWRLKKEKKRLNKFKTELDELKGTRSVDDSSQHSNRSDEENPEGIKLDDENKNSFFTD